MTCPRYGTCKPSNCECAKPFPVLVGEQLAAEQARTQAAMTIWPVWGVIILGFAVLGLGIALDHADRKYAQIELEERV